MLWVQEFCLSVTADKHFVTVHEIIKHYLNRACALMLLICVILDVYHVKMYTMRTFVLTNSLMNKHTNQKFIKKLLYKFLMGAFIHFFFVVVLNIHVKGKM